MNHALHRVCTLQFNGHKGTDAPNVFDGRVVAQRFFPQCISLFNQSKVKSAHGQQGADGTRACHGMTSKGGDVTKRWGMGKALHETSRGGNGANWHPTSQGFAHAKDIWMDLELLKRPWPSSPAHAALNFIQNQQGACLGAPFPERMKPCPAWNANTSIALNGFNNNGSHRLINALQAIDFIPSEEFYFRKQRAKRRLSRLI